jgi:hypothetical protein
MVLKLEGIVVGEDGSVGATDWILDVKVAGSGRRRPPRKSFGDHAGLNVVVPSGLEHAEGVLEIASGQTVELEVTGRTGFGSGPGGSGKGIPRPPPAASCAAPRPSS